jgi:hypothetical protein
MYDDPRFFGSAIVYGAAQARTISLVRTMVLRRLCDKVTFVCQLDFFTELRATAHAFMESSFEAWRRMRAKDAFGSAGLLLL